MEFETFEIKQANNKKFVSEAGQPTLVQYEYNIDSDGVKSLVKTDKVENVQARIDADIDSCNINLLMQRFALGDEHILEQREAFYADVRDMPTTYAEVFQRAEEAKQYFVQLDPEIKQMFNNSAEQYYAEMGTKTFDLKVAKYNEKFKKGQEYVRETKPEDIVIPKEFEEIER